MLLDKFTVDGKKSGQVELADDVFAGEINDTLIYQYINAANAALRQGTHKTKERSAVRGGGVKPWRQKGTGRARQGSIRAPQWVGGGTVFGPTPRSYSQKLNKKVKQAAVRAILSVKAKENKIKVIDDFDIQSGKTKDMFSVLKKLDLVKGTFVTDSDSVMLKRSAKNIEAVKFNNVKRINGRDLFYSKQILLTESAIKYLNEKYSKGE
ncbi:MAG: 50S ribosomal protein L4 [Spirochaetes bacterium]|nr:50S ribosomal protein L4 [Spirochaetota bacterium]